MRVAEIMTTDVVTVGPETPLKEVAVLLASRGISGCPVVDADGGLLGVVSEADILAKERRPPHQTRFSHLLGAPEPGNGKALARTAGEAMTSPAITVDSARRVDAAAALMLDKAVNRLPVVGRDGRLVGIVTRADLVRAFVHSDEEIEREIREEVLLHELWLDPTEFELSVSQGEVEISGEIRQDEEAALIERRVRLVPGVVSVRVTQAAAH